MLVSPIFTAALQAQIGAISFRRFIFTAGSEAEKFTVRSQVARTNAAAFRSILALSAERNAESVLQGVDFGPAARTVLYKGSPPAGAVAHARSIFL